MKYFTTVLILFLAVQTYALEIDWLFIDEQDTIRALLFLETEDNGFIFAGHRDSLLTISRIDNEGNMLWQQNWIMIESGGYGIKEFLRLNEEEYIILGNFNVSEPEEDQDLDIFFFVFNEDRDSLRYHSWSEDGGNSLCLGADANSEGNVYISKLFQENINFDPDHYLIRVDPFEEENFWEEVLVHRPDPNVRLEKVKTDSSGNIYMGGRGLNVDYGAHEFYVIKINQNLEIQWDRIFNHEYLDFHSLFQIDESRFGIMGDSFRYILIVFNCDGEEIDHHIFNYLEGNNNYNHAIKFNDSYIFTQTSFDDRLVFPGVPMPDSLAGDYIFSLYNLALDSVESVIWDKDSLGGKIHDIKRTNDGGIAMMTTQRYFIGRRDYKRLGILKVEPIPEQSVGNRNGNSFPESVLLDPAYPNPFNSTLNIPFSVAKSSELGLEIIDVNGRIVEVLKDGLYSSGEYLVKWTPENLNSGTLFIHLKTKNGMDTRKGFYLK